MCLYPGGTWWDTSVRGHRFWQNFLCDLEWRVALNGQPNPLGSTLAQGAMLLLVIGFLPFWLLVPRLFVRHARLAAAVRVLGTVSVGGMIAVTFMPSERFGALHGAMVVLAGVPGLTAAALSVTGLALAEPRPRVAGGLGAFMLVFATVDFTLYVAHLIAHVEGTALVASVQKIALMLLLAWMVVVAVRAPRAAESASASAP